jgi:hypothetical protein
MNSRCDRRMDAIAARIDSALDGEDCLEVAVVLGEALAKAIALATPETNKRRKLIELFVFPAEQRRALN